MAKKQTSDNSNLSDQVRLEVSRVSDSVDLAETNRVLNLLFDNLMNRPFEQRAAWFYLECDRARVRANDRARKADN